jgi:hypothetical protein
METTPKDNPVSPEAMHHGYEPQRISIRALLLCLVFFVAGMVALEALLKWMMHDVDARQDRADVPQSIFRADQQPPSPNLQPSVGHDALDYQDLEQVRRNEDQIFSRLGWEVDPATHRVTIPAGVVKEVAENEKARAAAAYVPPTTTGKQTNSETPGAIPQYHTRPGINGGQRP